jgi:hypothetical protein
MASAAHRLRITALVESFVIFSDHNKIICDSKVRMGKYWARVNFLRKTEKLK